MKKHAIIPIFIPHRGCPNDCVFCNQRAITAQTEDMTAAAVRDKIEVYLNTLAGRGLETVEVAFFGGSFTGIPLAEQSAFLAVAKEYKDKGRIDKIHLSTRPDYIDVRILRNLKHYGTDVIELGVQSFDDAVLAASRRGHSSAQAEYACGMVKDWGFELGIQLMVGLPGDSRETALRSAERAAALAPASARLYPTVILCDTRLMEMYRDGSYVPLTQEDAVEITAEMYKILVAAGVRILRVGLKSTDLINDKENSATVAETYHPAFRQLVEGRIAREALENQIKSAFPALCWSAEQGYERAENAVLQDVVFACNARCFSNMIGHKGENKAYFSRAYPKLNISYSIAQYLADDVYVMIKS